MNWTLYDLSRAPCLPCCNAGDPNACYLTVPTLLIDGNTAPFANLAEAQNFFDNSGGIGGCSTPNLGEPACDCLVESQTNHAPNIGGVTSWDAISGNGIKFISTINPQANISGNHAFLWGFHASGPVSMNMNVVVGCTTFAGFWANVSLFDSAFGFIASNVIANANINTFESWQTWQNLSINSAGNYYFYSNFSVSPLANNLSGEQLSYGQNTIANANFDVCTVRGAYGNTPDYLYCQSGFGP